MFVFVQEVSNNLEPNFEEFLSRKLTKDNNSSYYKATETRQIIKKKSKKEILILSVYLSK